MREAFVNATGALLDRRPDVAVVLADIGVARFDEIGATKRHPDRVVNVGIREQLLIGVAAGMALEGMRPIVHSYAPFLVERAFEQIKLDLGHQGLGAILVSIGASYDAAAEGRTHQAPGDVALLQTLPDWTILVPGHPDEVPGMLDQAVGHDGRVYVRLTEETLHRPLANPNGSITVLRKGSEGAPLVLAIGPTADRALEATTGLDLTVATTHTIRPLDQAGLRRLATGSDVVVVEPFLEGTSAADVTAALSDRPHRLLCVGIPNHEHRHYGFGAEHMVAHRLDAAGIRRRVVEFAGSHL